MVVRCRQVDSGRARVSQRAAAVVGDGGGGGREQEQYSTEVGSSDPNELISIVVGVAAARIISFARCSNGSVGPPGRARKRHHCFCKHTIHPLPPVVPSDEPKTAVTIATATLPPELHRSHARLNRCEAEQALTAQVVVAVDRLIQTLAGANQDMNCVESALIAAADNGKLSRPSSASPNRCAWCQSSLRPLGSGPGGTRPRRS